MLNSKDTDFYIKELRSNGCQCGRPKKPGRSLCYRCYKALPRDMQRDLYKYMFDGYAQAYDAAVNYLKDE